MAQLTAKLFRDYFGGSWSCKISKNGEFQREIVFNWPEAFGKYASIGTQTGLIVPPHSGGLDNTYQVSIAGWRNDIRRWIHVWYNEFGGYGEVQWSSQQEVNGLTVLYGSAHECKQETDDLTEHIVMCEMYDKDNFKYTIQSFRKGLVEIVAKRIRTAEELTKILEKQVKDIKSFAELVNDL